MNTMNNTIIYSDKDSDSDYDTDSDLEKEYNLFQLDEEKYDNLNLKKKSGNISLKPFNVWDNFLCDHIDDQYIYTEIFKFMNIKTLLNLRLGNKMLNNLITDYFNYLLKNNELLNKVKDSHNESLCNMIESEHFYDKENKIRYYNKANKKFYKYILNKHINNIQENTIKDEENIYKTISLKFKFINKLIKPKNKQIKHTLLKIQKRDNIKKSIQIRKKWVKFILFFL